MRAILTTATTTALAAALLWVPAGPSYAAAPRCHGQAATIVGTAGDDHLVGTDGPDVIVGLGGSDKIDGRGGDDVICAGANRGVGDRQTRGDDIDGGPGSDWIDPGRDRRPVSAQGHPDVLRYSHATSGIRADLSSRTGTVTVGADTDTIRVGEGLWVLGSQHDDVIVGTRFDDDLEGNRGADLLQGGPGNDGIDELDGIWSRSDRDADRKEGGPGDDALQATGGADALDGGDGDDFLYEQGYAPGTSMLGGPATTTCTRTTTRPRTGPSTGARAWTCSRCSGGAPTTPRSRWWSTRAPGRSAAPCRVRPCSPRPGSSGGRRARSSR